MAVINFAAFAASLPYATRTMTLLLMAFSFTLAMLRILTTDGVHVLPQRVDTAVEFPYLVIVPGSSFWAPWTLVTSAFCETTVPEFIISFVALTLGGRYLERLWGATELWRFSLIVIVVSNVITWFLEVLLYIVIRGQKDMYRTQYHGLEALQTAFLVAFAQLIPEHQIQFKFGIKLRVRDLPMAYVTFSNVACLLGYTSPFILIQFGWLSSWAYLRFFKENESGIRGDRSETFSFVSWFPPFLHTPVTAISNFLYKIFLRLGVVQPWQYSAMGDVELGLGRGLPGMSVGVSGGMGGIHGAAGGAAGHFQGSTGHVAPYATRAEAERRRAMALKALDQRVKAGGVGMNGAAAGPTSHESQASPYATQTMGGSAVGGSVARPAVAAAAAPATSPAATNGRIGGQRPSASTHGSATGSVATTKSSEGAPASGLSPTTNGSSIVPRVMVQEASEENLAPSVEHRGGANENQATGATAASAKAAP